MSMRRTVRFLFCASFASLLTFLPLASLTVVCLASSVRPAQAQPADAVGIRAQGMAGAFTAVADDSSATWWNPAGLATGAYFNAIVEYGRSPDTDTDHRGVSLAFPALGLSYYRLTVSQIRPIPTTASSTASRQDPGTLDVRAIDLSQFGVTGGQSIGRYLVVGSTLKLVRAEGETHGGLDVGAMAAFGLTRFAVMVRNATEPTIGVGDLAVTLQRQVRVGAAVTNAGRSSFGGATVSFDADLTHVPTRAGDERRLAAGAEFWTPKRTLGARAGISGSTVGDGRTAVSGGLSVALHRGIYVEGRVTGGSDDLRRGWGGALRVTF